MKITLALGGGGVRGFAHIGCLKVLEAAGFQIQGVSGTSVGGLIGALYALGYTPAVLEERIMDIDQGRLFARMHGDGPALLGLAGVTEILRDLLGERTFSDLHIPLAITATDLSTGLPVIIKQGGLLEAILATSAVPGVFPAVARDGHLLVDGGVTNPIPVKEARALYPEAPVVAVILAPRLGWRQDLDPESAGRAAFLMSNQPLVYRLAGRLRLAQAFNIFLQSIETQGLVLADKQLKLEKPEVIIRPEVSQIGIVDRVDIPKVVRMGELAAQSALPEIFKALSWQARLRYKLTRMRSSFWENTHEA